MIRSEKLKVLIDSIKTANDLMRKQIEINGRAVELLGEFITEPESLGKDSHLLGGVPKDDKAPACLDGKGVAYIKPEEMKAGEWYVFGINVDENQCWLLKFKCILNEELYFYKCIDLDFDGHNLGILTNDEMYFVCNQIENLRPATQAEILRYFPHEIECPTHGGNDAAYIKEFTDPQL